MLIFRVEYDKSFFDRSMPARETTVTTKSKLMSQNTLKNQANKKPTEIVLSNVALSKINKDIKTILPQVVLLYITGKCI